MGLDLNTDFEFENISLESEDDGVLCATLIKSKLNNKNKKAVLYVHGYIDYFFHPHVADKFHEYGFDFYAIDLRRYGRSLQEGNKPNFCSHINEYFEEIDIAIDRIKKNNENIYLLGHSTGGLIGASYMNEGRNKQHIKGLILNSPFLDMNQSSILTEVMYSVVKTMSWLFPKGFSNKGLSPIYAESVHRQFKGEWDFNLKWKPTAGYPVYFKWFTAIVEAQKKLVNSDIKVPVLLMHSNESLKPKKHFKEVFVKDTVLDVEDMKRIGPSLGSDVKMVSVKDGMHDLFLSAKGVRKNAFKEMFAWLRSRE